MFTHRENLLAHAASHADGFSIGEDNYVDDFFGSFHASPPLHNHENMGEGSKRPPWKPNSLILKDGFDAYQVAYSAKERALRRISYVAPFCQPSLKTELTRDFSPERPKPPWRATVGRKLHCVTTDVQHEERSLGLREIHSRYSPTRTRSLSAGRNKKRESRGSSRNRAMANQRTFSNLPKSKGEKKAESISDRIRKEMKILSESRRVQRGNWTMAGSRFVSQVKQPAWAAPFASRPLPPPEKPKRSPPIRRTRALGHGRNVLKDMLDKLQSLSKSLGTSDSSEHIQILLELSRHWVLQKDLREALRVGILAKSIVGQGTAKSTIPKIDTVRSPFDSGSLGEVLNLEARVDHIIAHIVDARSSELREGLDLVPDFDVGDGSHIKNEDKRSDKWKHGRRYDDSSREDEDEKGSVVTAGSVAGGKYVDMQDVSAYTSSESLQ
ncbi:hypothetical protein BC829DRAFT_380254 [Chytridium lagenaria]|nr:hypothetical protein BC829DRAFT_380254 [Chytridium lagenaria]